MKSSLRMHGAVVPVSLIVPLLLATGAAAPSAAADDIPALVRKIDNVKVAEIGETEYAQWSKAVVRNQERLTAEQRHFVFKKLRTAFIPAGKRPDMIAPGKFADLAEVLVLLDNRRGRDLIRQWFEVVQWRETDQRIVARLSMLAANPEHGDEFVGSAIPEATLAEMGTIWEKDLDGFSSVDLKNAALAFGHAGDVQTSRKWGARSFEKLLDETGDDDPPKMATVREAADILYRSFQTGQGKAHPDFVKLLVRVLRSDEVRLAPADYERFGSILGTEECRDALLETLGGVENTSLLATGKILAWSYRKAGKQKEWDEFLDTRLAAAKKADTAVAQWTLLKGHGSALRSDREDPARRARWIAGARASARTPTEKLFVSREALEYFYRKKRRDLGDRFLGTIESELTAEDRAQLRKEWNALWRLRPKQEVISKR